MGRFGHLGTEAAHRRDIGQADRIRPARTVFGGQRAVEDRPAVVDLTQPVAVRDADVAVVRDVSALTVDRVQALDLDAENFESREEIVETVIAPVRLLPEDHQTGSRQLDLIADWGPPGLLVFFALSMPCSATA